MKTNLPNKLVFYVTKVKDAQGDVSISYKHSLGSRGERLTLESGKIPKKDSQEYKSLMGRTEVVLWTIIESYLRQIKKPTPMEEIKFLFNHETSATMIANFHYNRENPLILYQELSLPMEQEEVDFVFQLMRNLTERSRVE